MLASDDNAGAAHGKDEAPFDLQAWLRKCKETAPLRHITPQGREDLEKMTGEDYEQFFLEARDKVRRTEKCMLWLRTQCSANDSDGILLLSLRVHL